MSLKNYFIINTLIITISQGFLIFKYFKQRMFGKAASDLLIWLIITSFLFYNYYFRINVPVFVIFCSIMTVIGHSLLGNYLNYYYKSKTYDRGLHMLGAFSFSLLTFSILNKAISPFQSDSFYASLFVITLGISIGSLFEILEFIHDCVSQKVKCQHGLADTDYDLIFNFVGSIIAGFIAPFLV